MPVADKPPAFLRATREDYPDVAVQDNPYTKDQYNRFRDYMRGPGAPATTAPAPNPAFDVPVVRQPKFESRNTFAKASAYMSKAPSDSGIDSRLRLLLRFGPAVLSAIPAAKVMTGLTRSRIRWLFAPSGTITDANRAAALRRVAAGEIAHKALSGAAGLATGYGTQHLMDKNLKPAAPSSGAKK